MQLKEEWRHGAKNKGGPLGPPSFLFEPWRGARVGSHRCPVLRVRILKYSIQDPRTENTNTFDDVTVLIRGLSARESLRPHASSMCPLDLVFVPGVILIMERRGVPQDGRTDFIGVRRLRA
jgi:hypothetical protein